MFFWKEKIARNLSLNPGHMIAELNTFVTSCVFFFLCSSLGISFYLSEGDIQSRQFDFLTLFTLSLLSQAAIVSAAGRLQEQLFGVKEGGHPPCLPTGLFRALKLKFPPNCMTCHPLVHASEPCRNLSVLWWPDRWLPEGLTVFILFRDTCRELQRNSCMASAGRGWWVVWYHSQASPAASSRLIFSPGEQDQPSYGDSSGLQGPTEAESKVIILCNKY